MKVENRRTILVDLQKNTRIPLPKFIQGDSNYIDFEVLDNGEDANFSDIGRILINFCRIDGETVSRLVYEENEVVTYKIGVTEMEVAGRGKLEVQFYDKGIENRISTKIMDVEIIENIGEGSIEIDDEEYTLLQELFQEVAEAKDGLDEATDKADSATDNANNAADNADDKAEKAEQETNNLSDMKKDVEQTVSKAETDISDAIEESESRTDTAVSKSETATNNAQEKADYAEEQGDYAKEQGERSENAADLVEDLIKDGPVVTVNGMNGEVELDASDVGAETPDGAQGKSDKALDDAKEYTDDEINSLSDALISHEDDSDIHITADERSEWNGKQESLDDEQKRNIYISEEEPSSPSENDIWIEVD